MNETSAPNPGETLDEQVHLASRIVLGEVVSTDPVSRREPEGEEHPAQDAVIAVERTVKGGPVDRLTIHKPDRTAYYLAKPGDSGTDARTRGYFMLGPGDDPELVGYQPVKPDSDGRAVARLLAGLPAEDARPSDVDLAGLLVKADLVVSGDAEAIVSNGERSSTRANLVVNDVLFGKAPSDHFEVVRADLPAEVGDPWRFWGDELAGEFFLDLSGPVPVVLNPVPPSAYFPEDIEQAISAR